MATTNMSQGVADLARQVAVDQIAQDIGFNEKLAKKADLESPALTGTPTAPTASEDTNTDQIATTAFVRNFHFIAIGTLSAIQTFNLDNGIQ